MEGIVHFDFKGAPLKIDYIEAVFKVIKSWGATGVLLEWEDTFPYTSELKEIGSQRSSVGCGGDSLYSAEDVQTIFRLAKENSLEVIQLVQTIGHLEYLLKHPKFMKLRELAPYPAVLCPNKQESLPVVTSMFQQVLDAQPDAKYIHIGADESWHNDVCEDCIRASACNEHGLVSYLGHIRNVILWLKEKKPDLIVLMWEDMLRTLSADVLKSFNLGDLVQPVVWHYNTRESFSLTADMWETYRHTFSRVWVGSAFKGASGGSQVLSPVARYVSNHEGWRHEIEKYKLHINFVGIIFTGWSRYDHYAALCELMPVALPSLKSCMQFFLKQDNSQVVISDQIPHCEWAGEGLARYVRRHAELRDRCLHFIHGDQLHTWLNRWQVENEYSHPLQLQSIIQLSKSLLSELMELQDMLSVQLLAVTGQRSAEEWIGTYHRPHVQQMRDIHETAVRRYNAGASVQPRCIDINMDFEVKSTF